MKKALILVAVAVGIPFLVAVGFLVHASTIDSFTYETNVHVKRPIDEVWAVFADESRTPEWLQGIESMELVSGEPLEPGSVWRLHFEMDGQAFTMTETVTAAQPPTLYAFDVDNDYFSGKTEIRFVAGDAGTSIETTNVVAAKSAVFRSLFYLQRGMIAREATQSYENLRDLVESQGSPA